MRNLLAVLNLVDYIIIVILILSVWSGLRKGFILAAGSIISVIAGIVLAVFFYDDAALYLEEHYGIITSLADLLRLKTPLAAFTLKYNYFNPGLQFNDTPHYLAYLLIIIACGIAIFFLSSTILKYFWRWIENLCSFGVLSGINHFLGVLLAVLQSTAIMTVILGFLYPTLEIMANMGFAAAIISLDYISTSVLANGLLLLFYMAKELLGLYIA